MSANENIQNVEDIQVDADNLYREESITDLKVMSLRRMIPIKIDGSPDPDRTPRFMGQTHVMTQGGPVPINVTVEATTLQEACEKFPAAAKESVDRLIQEVNDMRRQEANRIIVPQGGQPGQPGQPGGGSGLVGI